MYLFQLLCLLPFGCETFLPGNIDSRVTDWVIMHIYSLKMCMHDSQLFISTCVVLLVFVQAYPRVNPCIPHTTGIDVEMVWYTALLLIEGIHL